MIFLERRHEEIASAMTFPFNPKAKASVQNLLMCFGETEDPVVGKWNQNSLDTLVNTQGSTILWAQDLDTPLGLFQVKAFADK